MNLFIALLQHLCLILNYEDLLELNWIALVFSAFYKSPGFCYLTGTVTTSFFSVHPCLPMSAGLP